MPDARLERTRRAYDVHVRFTEAETCFRATGEDALAMFDAAGSGWIRDDAFGRPCANRRCIECAPWRRPSETDAEQLPSSSMTPRGFTNATLMGYPIRIHEPCDDPACAFCSKRADIVFGLWPR
jgi:hypothetical protein